MEERTQAELAYKELSQRLLTGEIGPNTRIVEQSWAEKLSVNRSAVREALTRLLGEGAVYQRQHGGYFVAELSDEEIHEVREVREMIETTALSLACQRATPEQLKAIEETCDDFSRFVERNYLEASHEADLRFHQLLVAASGNKRLVKIYQRSHIPLFHRRTIPAKPLLEDFIATDKEHRLILQALKDKNTQLAIESLKQHFNRGEKDALT